MNNKIVKNSPFSQALIGAHQSQGNTNHCGPMCASMILNALSLSPRSGFDLAEDMNRVIWKAGFLPLIRRVPNWATFPWGVASVLEENGIKSRWKMFHHFDDLVDNIERQLLTIVIIGSWRPTVWAHYMIVAAYEPERGVGFVNSAHPRAELFWMPEDKFKHQWRAFGNQCILSFPDRR